MDLQREPPTRLESGEMGLKNQPLCSCHTSGKGGQRDRVIGCTELLGVLSSWLGPHLENSKLSVPCYTKQRRSSWQQHRLSGPILGLQRTEPGTTFQQDTQKIPMHMKVQNALLHPAIITLPIKHSTDSRDKPSGFKPLLLVLLTG